MLAMARKCSIGAVAILCCAAVVGMFTLHVAVTAPVRASDGFKMGRLLILTYAWGALLETDISVKLFAESLRETGSTADVVILTHDPLAKSTSAWLIQQHNFKVEMVPDVLMQTSTVSGDPVLFRFVAWNYYLKGRTSDYTHVMTTDLDVFFQADPLQCLPQIQALQVVKGSL